MSVSLPVGYELRAATLEDAQNVTDMMNAGAIDVVGTADTTLEDTLRNWTSPEFDLAAKTRLALSPDQKVAGYLELGKEETDKLYTFDLYLHPEFYHSGVGEALVALAEEWACQEEKIAPLDPENPAKTVTLQTPIWSVDTILSNLYQKEGFAVFRHFYRMQIDMETAPPSPELLEGITIRNFVRGQDEEAFYSARHEAFGDMWGFHPVSLETFIHNNITSYEHFEPGLWFMAYEGDQLAGVLLGLPLMSEAPDTGYIRSVAVRRPWRKRGVGMALLLSAFSEYYRRGIYKVSLGVDASSLTGATRLYERAGMRVVRRADMFRKTIPL